MTDASDAVSSPASAVAPAVRPAGKPWPVVLLAALTGRGALVGDAFRNGVEAAVQRINTAGGLFGRLVRITTFDTGSSAHGARATLHRALEGEVLALLGPVTAAATRAIAPVTRARGILQIAAGGGDLPMAREPLLLLADAGAATGMAMLAGWLASDRKLHRLAVAAESGRGGDAALLAGAWRRRQMQLVADVTLPHRPRHRSEAPTLAPMLARIADARPEVLFIDAAGAEAARIIRAARAALPEVMLIGTGEVLAPPVLKACGDSATGLRGFSSLSARPPLAPVEVFRQNYHDHYHADPDRVVLQGALALSMLEAALNRVVPSLPAGRMPTGAELAAGLRAAPVAAADAPSLLLDTRWDAAGEPHRAGFVAEVLADGGFAWSVVPPLPG